MIFDMKATTRSLKSSVCFTHLPQGTGFDQEAVDAALPLLRVLVKNITHLGGKDYNFNLEFECKECSGHIICIPDDGADDGPVTCKACGITFGTYKAVKVVGNYIGQHELKRRGLS